MSSDSHIVSHSPFFQINQQVHKPTILIIDDETDICYLLVNMLRLKNLGAVFASSLLDANRLIENKNDFLFIFLDNHLPDGLGVNYIRRLKKACPSSKVVMITAHDNQTDREKARSEGADFFIGKPFSRELIFKTIDALSA